MIDPDSLGAFVAVAQQRSFSRAADVLAIAQSMVSKRLRRLEDLLETRLIDRSLRHDIRLTRTGELFFPEALETLARLEHTERTGRNLGRGAAGPIRIGFIFSAAMNGTATAIFSELRRALPELQIQPRLMGTPEQMAALKSGHLDMALIRPRPSYPDGCRATEIYSEGLVACLSIDHRLAAADQLTPKQLAGEHLIVPQFHEEVGLIDTIRTLAVSGGFELPPIIRTGDFVTAAVLASAGSGIVLAPESLVRLNIEGVVYRQIAKFPERLQTMLVHRIDAPEAPVRVSLMSVRSVSAPPMA